MSTTPTTASESRKGKLIHMFEINENNILPDRALLVQRREEHNKFNEMRYVWDEKKYDRKDEHVWNGLIYLPDSLFSKYLAITANEQLAKDTKEFIADTISLANEIASKAIYHKRKIHQLECEVERLQSIITGITHLDWKERFDFDNAARKESYDEWEKMYQNKYKKCAAKYPKDTKTMNIICKNAILCLLTHNLKSAAYYFLFLLYDRFETLNNHYDHDPWDAK